MSLQSLAQRAAARKAKAAGGSAGGSEAERSDALPAEGGELGAPGGKRGDTGATVSVDHQRADAIRPGR